MSNLTTLPLNLLVMSAGNVRTTKAGNIDSLAASILSVGLLQNLVVVACATDPGMYEVAAGERRWRALSLLNQTGQLPSDFPVPVSIRDRADLTKVSLTENTERVAMNPADECEAFVKLTHEGQTIESIADAFGVTPLLVERRIALANASPKLFALLRTEKINTEQLRALCATNDHAKQERSWEAGSYNPTPVNLRRLVVGEAIDASKDSRVDFIGGVAAFESAGGDVRRDLFSDAATSGLIDDVALLETLVASKLDAHAETVRAEGWAWVEVVPDYTWNTSVRFGKLNVELALDKKQQKFLAGLTAKETELNEQLEAMYQDEDAENADAIEALETTISDLQSEIETYTENAKQFTAEAKANAGAIVALKDGVLFIERGLVKPQDRKAAQADGSVVAGGRETKAAGRNADALSDALARSLQGHRNIAVQAEVANNAHVAKVVFACWTVQQIRGANGVDRAPSDLGLSGYGIRSALRSLSADVVTKLEAFEATGKALVKTLPTKADALWAALLGYSEAQLDELLAYGVARSVNLEDGHKGYTGHLIGALNFDMSKHFEATSANYLGRVKKSHVVAALSEAGKADDKAALETMKSKELASEAERRLAGTGWVPASIRTPVAKTDKPASKKITKALAKGKVAAKAPSKTKPSARKAKAA